MLRPAAPDAIDPVIGWRAWALARAADGELELRAIVYSGETWPSREPSRAVCPPHAGTPHRSPGVECTCGLYAVDGLDRLPSVSGRDVTVIGSVALWGRLVEHDAGFRAEFAYPQRLRLVCGSCWGTGAFAANVVAVAPTSRGTLLALCSSHALGGGGDLPALERELLATYAVDPVGGDTLDRIAAGWAHPARRSRRRPSVWGFAMGFLFFAIFLGLVAVAVSIR